jgi:chromosome segregation ATPase
MKPSTVTVAPSTTLDEDLACFVEVEDKLSEAHTAYHAAESTVATTVENIHEIKRERLALLNELRNSSQALVDMERELPTVRAALAEPPWEIADAEAERDAQLAYLESCLEAIPSLWGQFESGDCGEEGRETVASKHAAAMKEVSYGRHWLSILNARVSDKVKDREGLEDEVVFMEAEIPRLRARLPKLEEAIPGTEEAERRLEGELEEQLLERNRAEAVVDALLVQCRSRAASLLDRIERAEGLRRPNAVDSDPISGLWQRGTSENERKRRVRQ